MQPADLARLLDDLDMTFEACARVCTASGTPTSADDIRRVIEGLDRNPRFERLLAMATGRELTELWPQWYAGEGVQESHAASLPTADSFSQQQNGAAFGTTSASNPQARLERLSASPRTQFLGVLDELTSLRFELERFDGEFQATDELVAQVNRIRGTLVGLTRHIA